MNFDLIIVGGGLAGASLAVALRKAKLSIAMVEGAKPVRPEGWDNRIYALSPVNQTFLSDLGVWQHLDQTRLTPVSEMQIRGDAGGKLRFSAYDTGVRELAWIVESSLLQLELWETLKRQHNVTLFCPAVPTEINLYGESAQLILRDGTVLRSKLVVGADGAKSWVRDSLGIAANISPYREKGVVANFHCEHAHNDIAHQWFREDGVLAWLPLPGKRISIVWSAPDDQADALLELSPSLFSDKVAAAGSYLLGHLELESDPAAFPLRFMRVSETVRSRVALIGDAAHAIHPLSGHGINLGFQDAKLLADQLAALPSWQDPGALTVLRRYARARAEEPMLVQYTTHALNRLFKIHNPVLSALRNAGMNLTGRLPVLKTALTRYAIGGKF